MKRDDLKALELADDVIDKIMTLHGKDVEATKTAAETAKAKAENLESQLKEANTAIEGFKKLDVDGIKKAADEWKAKAEQAEANAAQQLDQIKFDHALDQALTGAKVKDPVSARAHLKVDDLKLTSEGAITGLDEQLKKIQASHDFLFESTTPPPPKIVAGGSNPPPIGDPVIVAMRRAAGLPEPK